MTNMDCEDRNENESHATSPHTLSSNHGKFDGYRPKSYNSNAGDLVKSEPMICACCKKPIYDQYYMWVDKRPWHESCVQCEVCRAPLAESCYAKNHKLYCPQDYTQLQKCRRCSKLIPLTEFVLHVSGQPCHVTCFACDVCGRALQSGDQYLIDETTNQIYCRTCHEQASNGTSCLAADREVETASDSDDDELFSHPSMSDISYLSGYRTPNGLSHSHIIMQGKCNSKSMLSTSVSSCVDGKRVKRPRTILTTAQRRKFKASFEVSQKPCRKVRETLAAETRLSPRVVQVWFQNQRAKVKKLARRKLGDSGEETNSRTNQRRKKTLDSDSDNDLSSPASYASMTTSYQTPLYQETFQSPGSFQASPNASVQEFNPFCQSAPTTLESTSDFLYDELDSSLFTGSETFVTQTLTSMAQPNMFSVEARHQADALALLPSDSNNGGSSCQSAGLDGDLQPEPSPPQDTFPHFSSLQTLTPYPNHGKSEGNPIDRLMCMQTTFFTT